MNTPSRGHLFNFNSAECKNRTSCREGLRLDSFSAQPPNHKSHAVLLASLLPPSTRGKGEQEDLPARCCFRYLCSLDLSLSHPFHVVPSAHLFPPLTSLLSSLPLAPPSFHHFYMPFFFPFFFHVSSTLIWPALVFWGSLSPDVLGLTDFSKNCPPQPRSLTPSFPLPPGTDSQDA